jgi:uncharacterized phage protein gp47/JayE
LTAETVDSIRARMDLDANAGMEPTDPGYLDLTEGGFYFDLTQAPVLEAARLWDFMATEVVAAMFVQGAWGEYLDMHGEMLGVERKDEVKATGEVTFTGDAGTLIATDTEVAEPTEDPDADPVTFVTVESGTIPGDPEADPPITDSITLRVEAVEPGPEGNVAVGQVSFLLSPIDGIEAVNNASGITGGADVESDEAYQARLLLEWRSPGAAGNVADYERWALAYPGVGFVTVEAVWAGAWTVRLVVTDPERNPASAEVVTGLKALLDPGDGTGEGLAPVGANVTVATVIPVTINAEATVTFENGYSLDGASGTVALSDVIESAVQDYLNSLPPGEDVVAAKVESLFFRIAGIYDVSAVKLNGFAANFIVGPEQVAQGGDVTLVDSASL